MSNTNETKAQEVGISDVEKNRIFVTMNATFKDEERCRVAMETIVNDAYAAYGVNSHFWFRSKDGKSLFVFEQYEDKKALRKAIRRFTSARISFFRSIKVIDVTVYGSISTSSKLMFAIMKPKYMDYYGGYSKNVAKTKEAGIKDFERNRIFITTNASFKDEEKCKVAMKGLVEDTYAESGINSHFWCRSKKDGKSLFVLEQYADEKALIEHLIENPSSRADFFESIDVGDVNIYGTESDTIKEMFDSLNPMYMNYYGGYSK
ncbi:putative quinol monooxygenase [Aquimarina pacifica]|uniref:putative quinol monooxygenase n=1 Tax=Aquimarina pacifica TaxID=1296415 RepID=UPI001267C92B|nr:hypothetical protein [Aquimarina pacifica]